MGGHCGPVPEKLRAGLVTHGEKEQRKERPLHRWRGRLHAELAGRHADQDHTDDNIQLERSDAHPGKGMPESKHEKQSNLRVVL